MLGNGLVYTPDLMCFAPGRVVGFPVRLEIAPDLVVEVLSPGNKEFDLTRKRDDYARFGVGEYWAVDPQDGRVRVYVRSGPRLEERPAPPDRLECASLPGFALDLEPLRELARRK